MAEFTLGLDLGSRAVKAVLYEPASGLVRAGLVRDGTPDKAADAAGLVRDILAGSGAAAAELAATMATGYGRIQAAAADETTTEISCHAVGAAALHPEARTVIDIGGQDSKAIRLDEAGRVRDFAMNDRCAAGCGRFLEVAARILGTDVDGLSGLAREAVAEADISSMCVVFAESEVIGMLARGFPRGDIAAGIIVSIARRVAGLAERVGVRPPIVFTGGVAMNGAMVSALGRELRERLIVPRDPRITGALGAALLAARKKGFAGRLDPEAGPPMSLIGAGAPAGNADQGATSGLMTRPEKPKTVPSIDAPSAVSLSAPRSVRLHRLPALTRFDRMVANAVEYARAEKARGRKIVSIFCEFTPREVILAAGAVPVCACGGSHRTAQAAERHLPAGLCPLIKSSYGFALEQASPLFEMSDLVVAETTCDGKKKMFELLGGLKPVHVLELPQKPDEGEGFRRWLSEIDGLRLRLEALTGIAASDDRLRDAVRLMNRERALRRAVARLAGRAMTGREVLAVKSLISGIPEDLAAYEEILDQARALPVPDSTRPAVLVTGVPMPHGAEKVIDIIEEAGATVVAQENCTGLKPLFEDVDLSLAGDGAEGNVWEAVARKYFHLPCSCMTPNKGRMELLDRLIEEFRPVGVVDLVWQSCLTYDVESELVRRHIESRHGLPYLKLVTDYSPSDVLQLRLRVEAFIAMTASSVKISLVSRGEV